MPKISVIMSVYNETKEQVEQSIQSILAQTYSDFELIVINDNPKSETVGKWLKHICAADDRIHLYTNAVNIGLALSMNYAAEQATGEYLARMDADDISEITRFEKQVALLEQGKYDLICTGYQYIDERGDLVELRSPVELYTDEQLMKQIYVKNCIHHPTVMMTAKLFEKVGGYRDFPCAQDYDLWIRMAHAGARFHMIHEPLLCYRIRSGSVTNKKKLQQKLTLEYTRRLYIQRLKTGKDQFSKKDYNEFIAAHTKNMELQESDMNRNRVLLQKAKAYRNKKNFPMYFLTRLSVLLGSSVYRSGYIEKKKYEYDLWRYKRKRGVSE